MLEECFKTTELLSLDGLIKIAKHVGIHGRRSTPGREACYEEVPAFSSFPGMMLSKVKGCGGLLKLVV